MGNLTLANNYSWWMANYPIHPLDQSLTEPRGGFGLCGLVLGAHAIT